MLGAIFVTHGANALIRPGRLEQRAKPMTDRVAPVLRRASSHLPTETRSLIRANGAVQVAGGLLMMTPLRRVAAVALAASLLPTTILNHPLAHADDDNERALHREQFVKNVGLFGGLLLAAVDTGGQPSLRWRAAHLKNEARRSARRTARSTRSKTKIAMKSAKLGQHLPDWPVNR
jgi:uncharacterized membrane protein YphA (DoxX/SURF4 family)